MMHNKVGGSVKFTDKIKTLLANKTDAFSILATYETQVSILRQEFLDKLDDHYQVLFDREAALSSRIEEIEAERVRISREMNSIQNMTEYKDL